MALRSSQTVIHATTLAAVVGAASCACLSQYGLKMTVDASTDSGRSVNEAWCALGTFLGLLAAESALWRAASFLGYRGILCDKAAIKLDLFEHLSGHSGRYFSDLRGGALVGRISSTGESAQQLLTIFLFTITPIFTDFCVAGAILATIDWHFVAALVLFILLADGALIFSSRAGARHHLDHVGRAAEAGGELADVFSNIWLVTPTPMSSYLKMDLRRVDATPISELLFTETRF